MNIPTAGLTAAITATILADRPERVTTGDDITVTIDWTATFTTPSRRDANASHVETGIVMRLEPWFGQLNPFPETGPDGIAHTLWGDRPTQLRGVPADRVPAVVTALIDTARSHRAYQEAAERRRRLTLRGLNVAATTHATALELPDSNPNRPDTIQRAALARLRVVEAAAADRLLSVDDVAEAAGLRSHQVQDIYDRVEAEPLALYLGPVGFARRHGLTDSTVRQYKSNGQLPVPDLSFDDRDGWLLQTADNWTRPGQGARTDRNPASSPAARR